MPSPSFDVIHKLNQLVEELRSGTHNIQTAKEVSVSTVECIGQQRLATVLIAVRGSMAEAWTKRQELGKSIYEALCKTKAPARSATQSVSYQHIDMSQPVDPITCTHCQIRPGLGPCPHCTGVGLLIEPLPGSNNTVMVDCPHCEKGFCTCSVCGGTKESVLATVRYVTLNPLIVNHIIPCLGRDAISRALGNALPPQTLAYDIESSTQLAYRGASSMGSMDFHGYVFGDTIKQAQAFLEKIRTTSDITLDSIQTYALPYVIGTFQGPKKQHAMAYCIDLEGNLSARLL